MYKIIMDGENLAITERPTYISLSANGAYILTPEQAARGVAYEGTPYHLSGRPEMRGTEPTVTLVEFDAGRDIRNGNLANADVDAMAVDHELRITMMELGV